MLPKVNKPVYNLDFSRQLFLNQVAKVKKLKKGFDFKYSAQFKNLEFQILCLNKQLKLGLGVF